MNARVTPFIPFTKVLPKVDVFVTNGGFGAVNQALSMGVPIVIAGETEDKTFVAARVAWSGAGINLGTNRLTPEQLRLAVREVLSDGRYRANARRLQQEFAQYNTLDRIADHIESLVDGGAMVHAYTRTRGGEKV
jgi:UDP:flavonoid glycosyltransferase YjiC (YdhE family)